MQNIITYNILEIELMKHNMSHQILNNKIIKDQMKAIKIYQCPSCHFYTSVKQFYGYHFKTNRHFKSKYRFID